MLADCLNSDGATLIQTPTRAHLVAASTSLAPFIRQHFELPFEDPREQRVCPRLNQGFQSDQVYFSSWEIAHDPYYQEFLVPHGFGWNAAASLGGGLLISLKRGATRGRYDESELSTLNAALPGLRSASRVASLMWRSRLSGQLAMLEQIDRGAILIDAAGRVLEMNGCVQFGDGLDVSRGMLQATRPADRPRLQRFLAAALDPWRHSADSSTLILPRAPGGRPWLLDASVCSDALRSLHSHAAALVLITDIEKPTRVDENLLRGLFDLTNTEARLARELTTGQSLQQAACRLDISEGHARQRLKAIFSKTGTCHQVELVALLAKLIARPRR